MASVCRKERVNEAAALQSGDGPQRLTPTFFRALSQAYMPECERVQSEKMQNIFPNTITNLLRILTDL
jgi:hypothetical protein